MEEVGIHRKEESIHAPIVAIGASAGGIEAITELLKNLSPKTGMSYIYIQHLDPTHESMLSSILARTTQMKVEEARNGIKVEPNSLIIIPPDKIMTITDGTIQLDQRKAKPTINMPIDQFFMSLADIHRESSIGIVLSGNANDGTQGLKAIRMAGGITMVQDDTAKFLSMPRSAIAEDVVDLVLSPYAMAKELERISRQAKKIDIHFKGTEDEISDTDVDLKAIIQVLKKSTGVDFAHYKMNTIKRRIIRRMLLLKVDSLAGYIQHLRQNIGEVQLLYQDLLINVTSFFRDPDTMEYLKKSLLPQIIKTKSVGEAIRIWVPACSTGEEAYSLAMLLIEILGDKAPTSSIQIFATDLSETAIGKARLGMYTREALINVSPKRVQRFFTKVDGSYRIVKLIRDMVVFATHNIFKDPPFSRLDLISCCNLLIYLDQVLQKKILATFHYALLNNGFLVLGKSETIGSSGPLFSQTEKKYKIFSKKKEAADKAVFEMHFNPSDQSVKNLSRIKYPVQEKSTVFDLEKTVDDLLLNVYVPPSVVVNQDLEILHFKGSTGLYLEPAPGKASLNLLKMAKPGLAFELRNAIHKANKTAEVIKKSGIEIKDKGKLHYITIEVMPIQSESDDKNFLIIFNEAPSPEAITPVSKFSKDAVVKKLQDELLAVREDMRSIVEEQEASNEELQSANEEIVSSNEELQSINEELETSKEEVESTNEELMTINTELQMRNEQLSESYEYSEAVFGTIREAVLVLDQELRVKSANKAFYKMFRMKEVDTEGMSVFDLNNKEWDFPKLRELLHEIIPAQQVHQGLEAEVDFTGVGKKTLIFNAKSINQKIHRQRLTLLAIEDITEHRQGQKIIAEREAWFRDMADNTPALIWVLDAQKKGLFFNKTWLEFTGKKPAKEAGEGWIESFSALDKNRLIKALDECFAEKKYFHGEFRIKRHDGEYRWVYLAARPNFNHDGHFNGFLGSGTEIHDQRMMHEELEKRVNERTKELASLNTELERSNNDLNQFAYVASHDLQEPLHKILAFADRLMKLKEDLPDTGKTYVEKMSQSAERMSRLIEELLNFSRISNSKKKFLKTDLNDILTSVLSDFEVNEKNNSPKVIYTDLPTISAVPMQMEQLFHNLISNGIKFSRKNETPIIEITSVKVNKDELNLYKLDPLPSYIEIIFKDNGIGIQPQYSDQIFEIFHRLNTREEYPGTGIGLALCKKIVNHHGGHIYVESKENAGSSFHVIIPVEQNQK